MIVLLSVSLGTGLAAALVLMPSGALTALAIAAVVASVSAVVAGLLLAWRTARQDRSLGDLEAQTGIMVAALRNAVERTVGASPLRKFRNVDAPSESARKTRSDAWDDCS